MLLKKILNVEFFYRYFYVLQKGFTLLFASMSTNPDFQNCRFHHINILRTHNY